MSEKIAELNSFFNDEKILSKGRSHLGLSQAGDPCDRRLWLYAKERIISRKEQRIFETGHRLEDMILDELEAKIKIIERQKEIIITDKVSGRADAVGYLRDDPKMRPFLIEIKTMNARRFAELKKGIVPKEYVAQINVYLHSLGLKEGVLVVLNKDTSELMFEPIKVNPTMAKIEIQRLIEISNRPDEPERLSIRGLPHTICQWCAFKSYCWGGGE